MYLIPTVRGAAHASLELPYAWCARPGGAAAIEPTPGWEAGAVYLGVPFTAAALREIGAEPGIPLLFGDGIATEPGLRLLRAGPPAGALGRAGRSIEDPE